MNKADYTKFNQYKELSILFALFSEMLLYPTSERVCFIKNNFSLLRELLLQLNDKKINKRLNELAIIFKSTSFKNNKILEIEYNNLFLVPSDKSLYPSESTFSKTSYKKLQEIINLYKFNGFIINKEFTGSPDHISIEFLFVSQLAKKLSENNANNSIMENSIWDFLDEHILKWYGELDKHICKNAQVEFYPVVSSMIYSYLKLLI